MDVLCARTNFRGHFKRRNTIYNDKYQTQKAISKTSITGKLVFLCASLQQKLLETRTTLGDIKPYFSLLKTRTQNASKDNYYIEIKEYSHLNYKS